MANQKYLHNVADTVIGKMNGVDAEAVANLAELGNVPLSDMFWAMYGKKIILAMKDFKPQALGKVAASAGLEKYPFYGWSKELFGWGFHHENSGLKTLRLLAAYVVASAILDIIEPDLVTSREAEEDHLLERTEHAMSHGAQHRESRISNKNPKAPYW